MSLELLEKNWVEIVKRVVEPLWKYKFKKMYEEVKLDKNDFESLAGEELTKAFVLYDPCVSNVYTYAKLVLARKAETELRDRKRDKRLAEVRSESIYKIIDDESNIVLEDIIVGNDYSDSTHLMEIELAEREIYRLLKPREKRIVQMSIMGFKDNDIAKKMKIDTKEIISLRRRLNNNSVIRRAIRKLGYLGGTENEI